MTTHEPIGQLLRRWREQRRRSQLDLSLATGVSARHLSFIETGRATPSPAMIDRLCEELDVPLRARNALHLAAGFAPPYPERPLVDLGVARAAVDAVLTGHEPHPALAVNARWELLASNRTATVLLDGVDEELLAPPTNVLRATLHPAGLAPRIGNYDQWRAHVCRRVRRQLERTAAAGLADLLAELESYPAPAPQRGDVTAIPDNDLVVPMLVTTEHGDLALHYALTVFGAPRDVTLDEIAIETFLPADERTAEVLHRFGALAASGAR